MEDESLLGFTVWCDSIRQSKALSATSGPSQKEMSLGRSMAGLCCPVSTCLLAWAQLNAHTVIETDIFNFSIGPNGEHPGTALIQANDGNLYGTVQDDYEFGLVQSSALRHQAFSVPCIRSRTV